MLKWVILVITQDLVGRTVYILKFFTLIFSLSWFKICQVLCFVFFCIYVIAVLFCLFLFSSLQIWVMFDFLDSSGLYYVFDFNNLTKTDRVFASSDTKQTISTEEWLSCICKVLRTNDAYSFFFLWVGTKVDKSL